MSSYLFGICFAIYLALAALIITQAHQRANVLLATCCCLTATWAALQVFWTESLLNGISGILDLLRVLSWYMYLLYLYKRSGAGSRPQLMGFMAVAAVAISVGMIVSLISVGSPSYTLLSAPILLRLIISISELLLIENLYKNLPERARWHVAIPCIVLGSVACFDILVNADAALFRRPSIQLESGRAIALIIIAPLLILTAVRGGRWDQPVRLSRSALFHSATLVLSGSVLLALTVSGELLRHINQIWGWVAELSLLFGGLLVILLFLSSRSARSFIDQLIVYHFFAHRYDYRVQWLTCIATLSGRASVEEVSLQTRAIRAVADVVNSPSGTLLILDNATGSLNCEASWNMPIVTTLLPSHALVKVMLRDPHVINLSDHKHKQLQLNSFNPVGSFWLVVPLLHAESLIGLVIIGAPRVEFRIDREVSDLLDIIGQEIGTYLAEQRASQAIIETQRLHEYGKRFAFVAHDVKNVSSQLALLLSNAENHLGNPAFQQDMLETVRSSVKKIDYLLKRLDAPSGGNRLVSTAPVSRLRSLLSSYQVNENIYLSVEHDGRFTNVAIAPEIFDTIIGHLLNNAIEAASRQTILIRVKQNAEFIIIEIVDQGLGMSAEFIRDELFSPFRTNKLGGSGIGAYQARDLLRNAGGELHINSQQGIGTTARLLFKCAEGEMVSPSEQLFAEAMGDLSGPEAETSHR